MSASQPFVPSPHEKGGLRTMLRCEACRLSTAMCVCSPLVHAHYCSSCAVEQYHRGDEAALARTEPKIRLYCQELPR